MSDVSLSELPATSELNDNDLLLLSKIDSNMQIEGSRKITISTLKNLINECIRNKMFPERSGEHHIPLFRLRKPESSTIHSITLSTKTILRYNKFEIFYRNYDENYLQKQQEVIFRPFTYTTTDWAYSDSETYWNPLDTTKNNVSQYVIRKTGSSGNNYDDVESLTVNGTNFSFLSNEILVPQDGELMLHIDSLVPPSWNGDNLSRNLETHSPLSNVVIFSCEDNNLHRLTVFDTDCDVGGNTLHSTTLVRGGTKYRFGIQEILDSPQSISYSNIVIGYKPM